MSGQQRFNWDDTKNRENIRKHGFGFELAQTAFEDPGLMLQYDRFVDGEDRWHAMGLAAGEILILVVHVVRYGDDQQEIIRIISARRAEKDERARYRDFNTKGGRSTFR